VKLLDRLEMLIQTALHSDNVLGYVTELLKRVPNDAFIDPVLAQAVEMLRGALTDYGVSCPDLDFYTQYCKKRGANPACVTSYAKWLQQSGEPLSIERYRLELDVYVSNYAVYAMTDALKTAAKEVVASSYVEARTNLMRRIHQIDSGVACGDAPEGAVMREMEVVVQEHEVVASKPDASVLSGFGPIDKATGGFAPGDLVIIGAHTGHGKSTLALNIVYGAYLRGKRVLYVINELQYSQVRQNLLARHTAAPQFWPSEQPLGISLERLRAGQLTAREQQVMQAAIKDLKDKHSQRGEIYLVQLPRTADLSYLEAKMAAVNSTMPIDVVVIDYLLFLKGRYRDDRVALETLVRETKMLAVGFDHGRGVPIVTPWQVSRDEWEKAVENGGYGDSAWAKTSEIENSADIIWWLLRTDDLKKKHQILAGISKNRRGHVPDPFMLVENFDSAVITPLEGVVVDTGGASVSARVDGDYDALLADVINL